MNIVDLAHMLEAAGSGDQAKLSEYPQDMLMVAQDVVQRCTWMVGGPEANSALTNAIRGTTASITPSHPGRVSNLPNLRQASTRLAALSEVEKRAIVDEPGCASNVHLLDLEGTEYVDGELPLFL